ncbi:hypothetical protein C1646_755670 [Rhizophagus diaphanus]|nr:hypothetical protein C1646_755670 [Rhizophagus diaphanus] [Rhizophagus sp. MUCL 43196]
MRNYYRLKSFVEYFIDIRKYIKPYYCTFNPKGEFVLFVLYRKSHLFIYIYSTQTNNNKLKCKRIYELPEDFELTELITRYDKLYLFSNDYAYELNTSITRIFIKIFGINTTKNFIGINTKDEIIVYSIELRIPIATLDINNDIQLYNFMKHTGLCHILLQLFDRIPIWKSIMDYCWKESLNRLNIENLLPNNIRTINKIGFGILDGNVWKIKVENVISKINFPLQISDEIIENCPYMKDIRKLFDVASSNYVQKRELEFN